MRRILSVLEGFFAIDLRTLAFVRVLTGLVILLDLASRARDLEAFYTDLGVVPRKFLLSSTTEWTFSVFALGGSTEFTVIMFVLSGVVALLLSLGYRTRWMTFLSWVLVMSLQNRNPLVCYGGDSVLRMLLFWGMFVPWGAKYSIDSIRYGFNRLNDHLPQKAFHIGTVGFSLQVLYVYLFTALFKNGPEWHSEGTAVYFALSIDELASRFNYLGRMLPMNVLKGLNWSVLAYEWIGPILVAWPNWRVRMFALTGFILLQVGFNVFLVLGLFPVFSTLAIFVFIPSEFWDRLERKFITERIRNLSIYYDPSCGFCQHMVIAMNRFLLFDGARLIAADQDDTVHDTLRKENSWVVVDSAGNTALRSHALVMLLTHSPLFWPFAKLLGLFTSALDNIYRWLAKNRPEWPSFSPFPNGIVSRYSVSISLPATVVAVWCLLYITLFNVHRYDVERIPVPENLRWVSGLFKVDQNWAMFAPAPYRADGWYLIPAELRNGDTLDLFLDGAPINWSRPERTASNFRNTRWSKYLRTIRKGKYLGARKYYLRWLWKNWDDRNPAERRLKRFTMYFMLENNLLNWETEPPRKVTLWHQECLKNSEITP